MAKIQSSSTKLTLPIIIFAQFAGTSLWFAGNAILPGISAEFSFPADSMASITSAVQLGFIVGTFLFALSGISDRFSSSRVFLFCALAGAAMNAAILLWPADYVFLLSSRFFTGFFLAGIYPVGMKIASEWYGKKLGMALGYLVGALVLGTAFPHFLSYSGGNFEWKWVIIATSAIAAFGGFILYFLVGDGPLKVKSAKFKPKEILAVFTVKDFRKAAFGYFGHMWELYTFWAFVPILISLYAQQNQQDLSVSLWTFVVIATGSFACMAGGSMALKIGSRKVAVLFLGTSAICCLLSPILLVLPVWAFIGFLIVWGFAVAGDSPQLSTLNAQTAPKELVGTALTITVSLGFFITIISLQLTEWLYNQVPSSLFLLILAPGPIIGWYYARRIPKLKLDA